MSDIGRNDPCHCGSGKKYKKCHLEKDEVVDRKAREKAALNAAKVAAADAEKAEKEEKQGGAPAGKKPPTHEGKSWLSQVAGKVGFFKSAGQRRTNPTGNKGG